MREPQEIQDEAHEQVAERVAAVDVAKASGMVCTRVPHPSQPGRRLTKVWEVAATTGAIIELGDHLAGLGGELVMLRPNYVRAAEIRQLCDYTRMRVDLNHERARNWQRLEKLLKDLLNNV